MQNNHSQIYFTIFALLVIFNGYIYAADKPVWAYNYFSEFNATRFIENKGQLTDSDGKIRNDIRFYISTGNATVYFLDKSLIFSFSKSNRPLSKSTEDQTFNVEYSNLNLNFINSAAKPEINFTDPTDDYLNFYYPHCPEGITYVKSYRKIIYRNLYRGIDLVFYATGDKFGFKYDFIVHKGGNVNDIKLKYENADKLEPISDGSVSIRTNSFQITEKTPFTYQYKAGKELPVRSALRIQDNIITFDVKNYDKKKDLIIDPIINWATYYGGGDGDHSASIALDNQTNVIISGNTLSKNLPVTNGTVLKGAYDIFVAKFDYSGKRLWATYYGGRDADYTGSVAVDPAAHIYVTGWTWDINFPVTANCFQPVNKGGQNEGYLFKLTRDGIREWATFIGGSNDEHLYSIAVDKDFDLVVAGWSKSSNYPNDSLPINPKKQFDDIVLTSFKSDGTYNWSTFLGGDSADAARCVIFDSTGNIILTGETHSSNFKLTANAQQSFYGGDLDAVVAKFTNKGILTYSSYFGGSKNDYGTGLATDNQANLYITGYTFSKDMPVTSEAFQKQNKGLLNAFIAKYSNGNQLLWSTYLGGSSEDYSYAIATDRFDNVMITGQTSSGDFPTTMNAVQTDLKGVTDAFGAKFTPDGKSPYWITYYGGDNEDMGNDITVDYYHNIYITGDTKSTDFPVTQNAFQKTLAGQYDCFIFKHCATSPFTDIKINGSSTFCDGETAELDAGPGFLFYEWSNGETTQKINVGKSGSYTVKVTDTMYCDYTAMPLLINVLPLPQFKIQGNAKFCEGDSAVLIVPDGFVSWNWSNGDKSKTSVLHSDQRIILAVTDDKGCTGYDTAYVVKNPRPKPLIHGPKTVCAYSTNVTYYVYGVAGHSYQWVVNGGDINAGEDYFNVQINWNAIGKAKIYIYQTDNTTGCVGVDSFEVNISDHLEPQIVSNTGRFTFCDLDSMELDAGMGYIAYKWNTGSTSQTILIKQPGRYIVKVTGEGNCIGYDTVDIQLHPAPSPLITGDTSVCFNSSFSTYQSIYFDSHQYTWDISNGNIVSGNDTNIIQVSWSGPGIGRVRLIEYDTLTGCSTIAKDLLVNIYPSPDATITPSGKTEFCDGDSVILSAPAGNTKYDWSNGDTTQSIVAKIEGVYKVIVTSANNCVNADSINITILPSPAKPTITAIDDTLISSAGQIYEWYADGNLVPGETSRTLITQKDGKYTVVHKNIYGCSSESDEYDYKYVPKIAYVYISLPDTIFVRTGDPVIIPAIIDSSRLLQKVKAKSFTAYVSFDGYVLAVDDQSLPFTRNGSSKTTEVKGDLADTTGILFKLMLHAALGDSVCTNVTIDTIKWENANVVSKAKNTVVCITNICKEAGTRLYFSNGQLALGQNIPNPVSDETEIEFSIIEKGRHTLVLTDIFGIERLVLLDGDLEPGGYKLKISAKDLTSGTYFYILTTPTRTLKGKMQVIK